jgi:hypothetical protein
MVTVMMLLAALHQLFATVPVPLLRLVGLFLLTNQEEEKAGHHTMSRLGQLGVVGLGLLLAILMLLLRNSPLGVGLLILPAVFAMAVVWSVGRRYPRLTVVMAWLVLWGFFLMWPASVTAVAAGMVMAVTLKGKARLAGFLSMLFVPGLHFGALVLPWYHS